MGSDGSYPDRFELRQLANIIAAEGLGPYSAPECFSYGQVPSGMVFVCSTLLVMQSGGEVGDVNRLEVGWGPSGFLGQHLWIQDPTSAGGAATSYNFEGVCIPENEFACVNFPTGTTDTWHVVLAGYFVNQKFA